MGTCADQSVLCEQLCIATATFTYECACWDNHVLIEDGISCIVNTSNAEFHFMDDMKFRGNPQESREKIPINKSTEIRMKSGIPKVGLLPGDIEKVKSSKNRALRFDGNSFVQFPTVESAYLETNITIVFKFNVESDGVILYAGQNDGLDFISLAFVGQDVILRFNCGEGTVDDLYSVSFEVDQWHTLVVRRKFCSKSEVKVDKKSTMVDEIREFTNFKGITIDDGIFVGGIPLSMPHFSERVTITKGFAGCIRRILINNETLFDADKNINLAKGKTEYCEENITNSAASLSNEVLRINVNQQIKLPFVKIPEFSQNSSIKLLAPNDIELYSELKFHLKIDEPNGLIYFCGSKTHYLAIYVKDMFLNVQFSRGADYFIQRSEHKLSSNSWHLVELWRSGLSALLKIEGQLWVENQVKNGISSKTKTKYMYFGSVPSDLLPFNIDQQGFSGCLKKVHQNGKKIHFFEEAEDMMNINECGWKPCADAKCQAKATCLNRHTSPVCLCPFPSFGDYCENEHQNSISQMRFSKFSHLHFSDFEIMRRITGEYLNLSVTVKPNDYISKTQNQIIASAANNDNLGDYFHLMLTEMNEVLFTIDLGSGALSLTHPIPLDNKSWHNITVYRKRRNVYLTVNTTTITSAVQGSSIELNVYDSLFIGGKNIEDENMSGFNGCIRDIMINSERIDFSRNSTKAINISECLP